MSNLCGAFSLLMCLMLTSLHSTKRILPEKMGKTVYFQLTCVAKKCPFLSSLFCNSKLLLCLETTIKMARFLEEPDQVALN